MNEEIFKRLNDLTDRVSGVELSNATYVQHSAEIARQIESVRVSHAEYKKDTEKKFEDVCEKMIDKTTILICSVKDHFNHVIGLSRKEDEEKKQVFEAKIHNLIEKPRKVADFLTNVWTFILGVPVLGTILSFVVLGIKELLNKQ